jgi:MOSC domain-containing protein YiiM
MIPEKEEKPYQGLFDNYVKNGSIEWIGIRTASNIPMKILETAIILPTGIEGDRASKNSPLNKRQVTIIQKEHLDAVATFLNLEKLDPALLRRNIVVKGINLYSLKNRKFKLGEAVLEMTGFCYPCGKMEKKLGKGGFNAMRGHGGITCKVLSPGEIKVGDFLVPFI